MLALAVACGLATSGLPATDAGKPPRAGQPSPRLPIERATVELVLIEAYVTDLDGRSVPGLTRDDFILKVDGDVSPIASVEYREIGPSVDQSRPRSTGPGAGDTERVGAGHPPRRFLLFFEDGTSAPQGLAMARRAVERFLTSALLPEDQVAIVSLNRRLRFLQDFTTDRDRLLRVVRESLDDRGRVSDYSNELLRRDAEIKSALGRFGRQRGLTANRTIAPSLEEMHAIDSAAFLLDTYSREEAARLRGALAAARALVDSLAGWPGYKALVFMGDGVPENPAQERIDRMDLSDVPGRLRSVTRKHNLSFEFRELIRSAGAAGVTVHTLQTTGLVAGEWSVKNAASKRADWLRTISFSTGGIFSSSNDLFNGLVEAESSGRAYYILGYMPEGPPDGIEHSVRLRVKGSDLRIRWRRSFTRRLPEEVRASALVSAYLLPEMYKGLEVDLSAVAGPREASGRLVDLVVHLPRNAVLFLPEGGKARAHLEIGLLAVDEDDKESLRTSRQFQIALPTDPGAEDFQALDVVYRVRLPETAQTISAVISDTAAGALGAARLDLQPASREDGMVSGLSLYSLGEKSLWIEGTEFLGRTFAPRGGPGHTVGPALRSRFAPEESLACGFKVSGVAGAGTGSLRILVRQSDRAVRDLGLDGGSVAADGTVVLPLPFLPLQPGDYTLVVRRLGDGEARDLASLPFRIRPSTVQ
jgi:VWFA-related protein